MTSSPPDDGVTITLRFTHENHTQSHKVEPGTEYPTAPPRQLNFTSVRETNKARPCAKCQVNT